MLCNQKGSAWNFLTASFNGVCTQPFEEPPLKLAKNVSAKISFGSAIVWWLLTVRFHCLDDSLQLWVARVVVETSFASPQENVVEIGFDDRGKEDGVRRNWWRKEVKIHDKLSCTGLKLRHRSDENQKEDCLHVKKKQGKNGQKDGNFNLRAEQKDGGKGSFVHAQTEKTRIVCLSIQKQTRGLNLSAQMATKRGWTASESHNKSLQWRGTKTAWRLSQLK